MSHGLDKYWGCHRQQIRDNFISDPVSIPYESLYKSYIIGNIYESTFQFIKQWENWSFLEEVMTNFPLGVYAIWYGMSQ